MATTATQNKYNIKHIHQTDLELYKRKPMKRPKSDCVIIKTANEKHPKKETNSECYASSNRQRQRQQQQQKRSQLEICGPTLRCTNTIVSFSASICVSLLPLGEPRNMC